ncbi:60S ribosomal protein L7A [Bulinus truncatus]|nr:60S ribosomal protein L7A [Bulinus truncatus]
MNNLILICYYFFSSLFKENSKKARLQRKADVPTKRPPVVRSGINTVTALVESKKAQLVIIAHAVDPIEIVLFPPALCRKMAAPYCIVKGKARLGQVVHRKTATCLAFFLVHKICLMSSEDGGGGVDSEDRSALIKLIEADKPSLIGLISSKDIEVVVCVPIPKLVLQNQRMPKPRK